MLSSSELTAFENGGLDSLLNTVGTAQISVGQITDNFFVISNSVALAVEPIPGNGQFVPVTGVMSLSSTGRYAVGGDGNSQVTVYDTCICFSCYRAAVRPSWCQLLLMGVSTK